MYTYEEMEDIVEEMLNDGQEPLNVGPVTFYAGTVLRELDPLAFEQEVADYVYDDEIYEA